MRDRDDARYIAEQNAAYRRGVVLGLTMAEVGILIIFVLLLLIGFNEWTKIVEREAAKDSVSVAKGRMAALEDSERQFAAVAAAVELPPTATEEEIRAMVRAVVASAATPAGQSSLQEVRTALDLIRRIRDELIAKNYPKNLIDQIERQGFTIANQQGQLAHYEKQLLNAGLGKGERPCWVKPDGTIEFLFDVVLASNGIRMRENVFPNRDKERSALPMAATDPNEVLTEGEFLRRTAPLYNSSLSANCRFFVTVYDATGPAQKDLYKSLMRTVEGHFYKRLSLEPAPF
jgi:hypothetical protein